MTDVLVKPAFIPSQPDSGDATKFGPNAWNAARLFSAGALGDLLYRDTGSATGASWLPDVAVGSVLVSGGVGATPAWSASPSLTTVAFGGDALLTRDAANILAQRNGVNAQASRIYGTFTDASNYERLDIGYGVDQGTTWGIVPRKAGTGTLRAIQIGAYNNAQRIDFYGGNAKSWSIEATNANLIAGTDNAIDIGAAGTSRPRSIFVAASVVNAGYDEFTEIADPAAGGSNSARLYAKDNGAGKTLLVVRFASGAVQTIATEP